MGTFAYVVPLIAITAIAVVALALAASAVRIVREYERLVVFRLGRLRGARGPGLVLIIPVFECTRCDSLLGARQDDGRALLDALSLVGNDELLDVDYETELIGGPPAQAIADVARVREADEIVVGARGLGRVRALLGSVSRELLHIADRPVVVIPAAAIDRQDRGARENHRMMLDHYSQTKCLLVSYDPNPMGFF